MHFKLPECCPVEVLEDLFQGCVCERNQIPAPSQAETCAAWRARVQTDATTGLAHVWVMEWDGAAVGTVRIGAICRRSRSGQLSYWVAPEHRGRGHGARGAGIAAGLAFVGVGLKHLDTYTEAGNAPSRRIVTGLGFRLLHDPTEGNSILHYRLAAIHFQWQEYPMLVIRQAQLQAFRDEELRGLAGATVEAVAQRQPHVIERLTHQGAIEIAHAAALRARKFYEFRDAVEIGTVVRLALCIGPYFDLWPKANRILASDGPPKTKFAALNEALSAQDWEAAAAYAPSQAAAI